MLFSASYLIVFYLAYSIAVPPKPILVITTQHTIWTSTDFISLKNNDLEDVEKQKEELIASGNKPHIGIPEEVIIMKPSNLLEIFKANNNSMEVALVVLRPTFLDCLKLWKDVYDITLFDNRDNISTEIRLSETRAICRGIEFLKFNTEEIFTSIIADIASLPENYIILTTNDTNADVTKFLIRIESFMLDRLLESQNEDILAQISQDLMAYKQNFSEAVETMNAMSWHYGKMRSSFGSSLEFTGKKALSRQVNGFNNFNYDLEALLQYKVSNSRKTLMDTILRKLGDLPGKCIVMLEQYWVVGYKKRKYIWQKLERGTVHDLVLGFITKHEEPNTDPTSHERKVEISYVEFKTTGNTVRPPYVIYVSNLIDLDVVDYPKKTPNLTGELIPQLQQLQTNSKWLPDYFPLLAKYTYNPELVNLVVSLEETILYAYKVIPRKLQTPESLPLLLEEYTDEDVTATYPNIAEKYKNRLTQPNHSFTVTFQRKTKNPSNPIIFETLFIILRDGIIDDLKELMTKFNLILVTNWPSIKEMAVVDALERKFGKIFFRRFTSSDYNGHDCIPSQLLTNEGYLEEETVHMHVNSHKILAYKYAFLIDRFNPCNTNVTSTSSDSTKNFSHIKNILKDELSPAIQRKDAQSIHEFLIMLSNLRFRCIDNPNCPNLMISVKNLIFMFEAKNTQQKIDFDYLQNWIPYYNIIPWSPEKNYALVRSVINEIEEKLRQKIFSEPFGTDFQINPKTIIFAANVDEIQQKYRKQTILNTGKGLPFLNSVSNFLCSIAVRKGSTYPKDSIEAFNFRLPVAKEVAEILLGHGQLISLRHILQLPVLIPIDEANYCFKSFELATLMRPDEIKDVCKKYEKSEDDADFVRTKFTLNGHEHKHKSKKLEFKLSLISHLTLKNTKIRYLVLPDERGETVYTKLKDEKQLLMKCPS